MKTVNHECYVSLEVAKLLKEVGFDWEVQSYYSKLSRKQGRLLWLECGCLYKENININQNRYSAPTIEVAQRWLRKVKGVEIEIHWMVEDILKFDDRKYVYHIESDDFNDGNYDYISYEEAQEAGIKKALEIILEKGE